MRGKGGLSGYRLALLVDFVAAQRLPLSITGATDFIKHTLPLTHTLPCHTHTHSHRDIFEILCVSVLRCLFVRYVLLISNLSFSSFSFNTHYPIE